MTSIPSSSSIDDPRFEATFLSGRAIYGDDFSMEQVGHWVESEREAYADLGQSDSRHRYGYFALNAYHGYHRTGTPISGDALGIGSAYGDELLPVAHDLDSIHIVEPSERLRSERIGVLTPNYVGPAPTGALQFPDAAFDLVTCFGVLHHIPNISFVLQELRRVLRPGGVLLVREPIHSMGDWRKPRPGLTKNERGIPLSLFRTSIARARLNIEYEGLCVFSLTTRLARLIGEREPFNSPWLVRVDAALARASRGLYRYHARSSWQKIRPTSVFYVLRPAR